MLGVYVYIYIHIFIPSYAGSKRAKGSRLSYYVRACDSTFSPLGSRVKGGAQNSLNPEP